MNDDRNYFGIPIPRTIRELLSPGFQDKLWEAKRRKVLELRDEIKKLPPEEKPRNILQVHFKRKETPRKTPVILSVPVMRELLATAGSLEKAIEMSGMHPAAFKRRALGLGLLKYKVEIAV